MQVRLDPEFGPDSLLGNSSTGLVLVDDVGVVSVFNRQAAKLLKLAPDRAIGSPLSSMVSDAAVEGWLSDPAGQTPRLSVFVEGRPIDLAIAAIGLEENRFRIVSIRDATKRRALESKALAYEKGQGGGPVDWNVRLKASSVLLLLREFGDDPTSLAAVWDMARRTGAVLFPTGGAICAQANGQFQVQSSWGNMTSVSAFPDLGCLAAPGSPSTACAHFSVGVPGVCTWIENGRILLARSGDSALDTETESLFAETVDYALANARA